MSPRFNNLNDWLSWQETLHPVAIELKLERIGEVAKRLGIRHPDFPIITIAGTNGKGSTVSLMDAILSSEGYKVGTYTSPHLINYNERIVVSGEPVDDAPICHAFAAIDLAREDISLTYFEFATLAAMLLFSQMKVDVAILEVGLGGRLDAVNVWDADAVIITSIDIDHVHWLGNTRESVGREKAGVMREGQPVAYAEEGMPDSVSEYAQSIGARLLSIGDSYTIQHQEGSNEWSLLYRHQEEQSVEAVPEAIHSLPRPALKGTFQYANAAAVLVILNELKSRLFVSPKSIVNGLLSAKIKGRLEVLDQCPEVMIDVAHNPHACRSLSQWLTAHPVEGKTIAVFSVLSDKDIAGIVDIMKMHFDAWYVITLQGERALPASAIVEQLHAGGVESPCQIFNSLDAALDALKCEIKCEDRVVGFGSFLLVSEFMHTYSGL